MLGNRGGCGSQTPDPGGRPSPVGTVSPCARVMDPLALFGRPARAAPGEPRAAWGIVRCVLRCWKMEFASKKETRVYETPILDFHVLGEPLG